MYNTLVLVRMPGAALGISSSSYMAKEESLVDLRQESIDREEVSKPKRSTARQLKPQGN